MRRLFAYLRYQWLWVLSGIILAIIILDSLAELPHGTKFIYPLRDLYFQVRVWTYFPLMLIVFLTASLSLPYVISSRIAVLAKDGRVGRHYIPRMRPFLVLFVISIIGFSVMSDDDVRPRSLETLTYNEHRYYLVHQDRGLQLDRYHLYACDRRGIVCEVVFTKVESENTLDIMLVVEDNQLHVVIEDALAYSVP